MSRDSTGDLERTLNLIESQNAAQRCDLERTVADLERKSVEEKTSLEGMLNGAREDADRHAIKLEALQQQESELQDMLKTRDEELHDLEKALGDSNSNRSELVGQIEQLRVAHETVMSDIADQRQRLRQQESEVQKLVTQIKKSEATASAAIEQNKSLEDALSITTGDLNKKDLRIRAVEKELVILEAQLQEGLSHRMELEKVVSKEEQAAVSSQKRVAHLEDQLYRAENQRVEAASALKDRLQCTTDTIDDLERTCAGQKAQIMRYTEELKGKENEIQELQVHAQHLSKIADAAADTAMVDESRAETLESALERSVAERHAMSAQFKAKLQCKVQNSEALEQTLDKQTMQLITEEVAAQKFGAQVKELLLESGNREKRQERLRDAVVKSEECNEKLAIELRCAEAAKETVADALQQQLQDTMEHSRRDISELKVQLAGRDIAAQSQEKLIAQLSKQATDQQESQVRSRLQKDQLLENEVRQLENQVAQLQFGEVERSEQHLDRFAALEDELERRDRTTLQLQERLGAVEETAQEQSQETQRLHNEVCIEMLALSQRSAEASEAKSLVEMKNVKLQDANAKLRELEMKYTTGYARRTELEKVLKAKDAHVDDLCSKLAHVEGKTRLANSTYTQESKSLQGEIIANQAQCQQLEASVASELARIEEQLNVDIEDRDVTVRNEVARAKAEAEVAQACESRVVDLDSRLRENQARFSELEGKLGMFKRQIELQNCEILAMKCERQADTEVTGHFEENLGSLRNALRDCHERAVAWETTCAEEHAAGLLQEEHLAATQVECAARTAECAGLEARLAIVTETAEHEWTKAAILQKQLVSEAEVHAAQMEKLQSQRATSKFDFHVDFGISQLEEHATLQASAAQVARQQIACLEDELDMKEKEIMKLEQEKRELRLARSASPMRDSSLDQLDQVKAWPANADKSAREQLLGHQIKEKDRQLQVKDEHIARLLNVLKEHRTKMFEDESTGTHFGDVSSRSSMQSGG